MLTTQAKIDALEIACKVIRARTVRLTLQKSIHPELETEWLKHCDALRFIENLLDELEATDSVAE